LFSSPNESSRLGHGSLGWNGKPVKLECPKSSLKEIHLYLGVYPELRKIA